MKKYNKDLHERLRHRTGLYCYNDNIGVDSDDIDALLDELERLQSESRWIPVSGEKLPEEDIPVLGTFAGKSAVDTCCYVKGKWWQLGRTILITHWRPLPQPPESDMSDTQNEERE